MKIIQTEKIGRFGLPICEIYNSQNTKIYEAHDDIVCEFWSLDLLKQMEEAFQIDKGDVDDVSNILKKAWAIWANIDNENKLYDAEKFQQLINLFREQPEEDKFFLIQEIVALLGKGVNRFGEKMRAMSSLFDERIDEILLYQGRGKPNAESLLKGRGYLTDALSEYCVSKGLELNNEEHKILFQKILDAALHEEHMSVFRQLK